LATHYLKMKKGNFSTFFFGRGKTGGDRLWKWGRRKKKVSRWRLEEKRSPPHLTREEGKDER